ncbi:hypothetical protein F4775DRAFT_589781 [Biscogniauxia sp. FL1348]|nr:hypothetical protein F4775DRAFT_589781 [Biscogniauxia sp. FL1348]
MEDAPENYLSGVATPKDDKVQPQATVCTAAKVDTKNETAMSKGSSEIRFFCVNCGNKFNPMANKSDSCHTHPGIFTDWLARGLTWKPEDAEVLEHWSCCNEIRPKHPGCKIGRHVSLSETLKKKK